MKNTGMNREIDVLGRIVIPKELRETMDMPTDTPLEFLVDDGGAIVLRKYEPGCILCSTLDELQNFHGKRVCPDCLSQLAQLKEA